jgi:NTP pyrophosphatase (non-canonical NTP hydrolase)
MKQSIEMLKKQYPNDADLGRVIRSQNFYEFIDYQKDAARTTSHLSTELLDNIHFTMGMCTEASELLDVFKKNLAYNKQIDWINVSEEVGDLMWYIANFCKINGINFEECIKTNIKKLKIRYPDKFNSDNAIYRDLDKERITLENNSNE